MRHAIPSRPTAADAAVGRKATSAVATFAYHRSLGPLVGIILALACLETFVVHIVAIAAWGWRVAVVLGVLDTAVIVSLVWLLRAFKRWPITLQDDMLALRTGARLHIAVPLENVAGFRERWSAEDLRAPHVLNMALAAWPNIVIDLHRPVARRRKNVTTIAHCVDDPVAFRAAVTAAMPSQRAAAAA